MAAPSLAPALESASRRRFFRRALNVPLDVIALRSGIPNDMPGRCTDLSEAGMGAIVAGELAPGQPVAIELRLPNVGLPVRARARVRYQDRLHCGFQFVGLAVEQREMIRYWASQIVPQSVPAERQGSEIARPDLPGLAVVPDNEKRKRRIRVRRRRFYLLLAFMLALAALGWWQWQRAWNDLETESSLAALQRAPMRVPPETMDRQIVYKVDPVYPEAARLAGTQGLVVLDALIAPDGTVKRLRPIAGPDLLAQSALDAVQSWRYTPYRNRGQAVEVETTISVDFRLR
ncbi:MAG: TonB family protein [Terriglobales bacterium]